MAEANPSLNSNDNRNLRNQIEILENNAGHLKREINDIVDSLIASINSQRIELLNEVDSEFHKAREPLKNFENKNAARVEARERLTKQLKGDHELLFRLTSEIDEELDKVGVDLPNFKIQWNRIFIRFCEDFEEIGQLKIDKHSQREEFEKVGQLKVDKHSQREEFEKVGQLKVDKHSQREEFEKVGQLKVDKHSRRKESKTPLWSTLNRGKADNEVGEPKAIAIDTETSNIYVGDASAGKILIMDKTGKYLNTLTFRKPSTISRMVICQNHIYCRTNNFFYSTLYRLDKNTGELLSKYYNISLIYAFTALPDQILLSDRSFLITLLPDLTEHSESKIISPHFKNGSSCAENMQNVNKELVMVISQPTDFPIQIFDKNCTFLRAIAGDIPVLVQMTDVYICIDEHWNIILSPLRINGKEMVNVYDKEGKFLTSIGKEGDENSGIYQPRGIALDRDGNLIVCNNRKENILQAY